MPHPVVHFEIRSNDPDASLADAHGHVVGVAAM
jgi:hypothetical protein